MHVVVLYVLLCVRLLCRTIEIIVVCIIRPASVFGAVHKERPQKIGNF